METELQNKVLRLAQLLQDWKGEDTVVLRLSPSISWASYCLISTCNSLSHMRGILNQLRLLLHEEDLNAEGLHTEGLHTNGAETQVLIFGEGVNLPLHGLPRHLEDASWCPIDMGSVVLHLMSREARDFYELEELWPVVEKLTVESRLEHLES